MANIQDCKKGVSGKRVFWLALLAVLVAAFLIANPPRVQALSLTLSDGISTVSSSGTGFVNFSGSVGDWLINVSTGITGSLGLPILDLNSINVNSSNPANLTLSLSQTGYTGPIDGNFLLSLGGVTGGTATFQAFLDSSNTLFGTSTPLGTFGPFGGVFSGTLSTPVVATGPYSLTLLANLSHPEPSRWPIIATSFNFEAKLPEPASLLLLGSGLTILGLLGTRRARSKEADSFPTSSRLTQS